MQLVARRVLPGPEVAPEAVAFHHDLVGIVGQPVHGALSQHGIIEEWDPLLYGPAAGDDGRGPPVSLDDDFIEIAGLVRVEPPEPEVIDDQQIWREQTTHGLLPRVVSQGLVEFLEHLVGAEEENLVAGTTSRMAQATGQQRLAHAHGAHKEDVLGPLDEAETEEIPDPIAIERNGCIPVEVLQGAHLFEAGFLESQRQVLLLAPVDLILEGQFQEVPEGQLRFLRVGHSIGERGQHPREFQSLEHGFQ